MEMTLLEVVGLIGVTLVVTHGSIFESLRDWLLRFQNPANFLRWLGLLVNCPQCSGFWVGALWGIALHKPWPVVFAAGGLVSLGAVVANFGLRLASTFVDRTSGSERTEVIRQLLEARAEKKRAQIEARDRQVHGEDLSEEDAQRIMDEAEERHDMVAP